MQVTSTGPLQIEGPGSNPAYLSSLTHEKEKKKEKEESQSREQSIKATTVRRGGAVLMIGA